MDRPGFHDVLFPAGLALRATGGLVRRTEVTQLASGGEVRRGRWKQSLRRWDAGATAMSFAEAEELLAFFEARQGRRFAFAFRDPIDNSSAPGGAGPTPIDQPLGQGDGTAVIFGLAKSYGSVSRRIDLARPGSLRVAVDGTELASSDFSLGEERNAVTLAAPPAAGAAVTAGFLFDVPVRFEADELMAQMGARGASFPSIPLVEVRL